MGKEEIALKLLADFCSKKPADEQLLSCSGEKILARILEMLGFRKVVNSAIQNDAKLDAGLFIEMIVVERALNTFSKWGLAGRAHGKSIFSLDTSIPRDKFTEANIYHYMDYLYPNVDNIQKSLVNAMLQFDGMAPKEIIIDGTSISCFGEDEKDDEIDDEDDADDEDEATDRKNETIDKYAEIKRLHGYNRDKRPDLAQVNLMLGVNEHFIPLFFQTFPGNAPDVYMFKVILEKCQRDYSSLLSKVRSIYIVFDKGNNSKDNISEITKLCEQWQVHFVASVRPSMKAVKKELHALTIKDAPIIYTQRKTVMRGETMMTTLYGKQRNTLLYLNEEIMKEKQEDFKKKMTKVKEEIRNRIGQAGSAKDKVAAIEKLLRKNKLYSCFTVHAEKKVVTCRPIQKKLEEKNNLLGKYALFTDDLGLDASSMMRIYKSTGVIEQEFHVLKSELSIDSVFHWKPERIQVHFALILWGMMALALLRQELAKKRMDYTFEELMEKIKEGQVSEGDYIYPGETSYRIRRTLNIGKELKDIFSALKIKWDYFDIETIDPGVAESTLSPTDGEQIDPGKITMEAKSGKNMQDKDDDKEIKAEM
nr:IS1634 family transposase [Candidatus Sigynarchaeum springense]